jgi:hypothetical protein
MSRLLKITDLGSGIMVQGTDNVLYPDNATLTYPYNSIIVVTDESNIATFRSASNNDVLFSGLIGKVEIGGEIVTKQNINTKFDAIANQERGEGGSFVDASYDSQTKRINFYDKDGNIVSYIDATDFIKDGMVSNVEILNGNLVITFNTDSGKQPISIPLTDIFNPDEYYTKTQVDTALSAKVSQTEFDTKEEVISTALNELASTAFSGDYNDLTNKPVIPTVPTNVSAFTNDAGYLTQHQSLDNYYTKSEVDAELADKQDTLTAGQNITIDANNVISSTGGTQQQADWNQSDSSAVDYIKNKPTIPDTSDFVSKTEYNPKEVAIAEALTDLNENKADKTELPDVSTFVTKSELNQSLTNYYTKTEIDSMIGNINTILASI